MAFDPRHVVAGLLTLTMFAMLGNMVKRDHFDSYEVTIPVSSGAQVGVIRVEEKEVTRISTVSKVPSTESNQELKACWTKPGPKGSEQSKGFITFSLTSGPEYHVSQIADAVVIARYLGATLVLPDIRGTEIGQKRNFQDMYDADKFMRSLDGVIKIVEELPSEVAADKPAVVRVPNRVSEDFIVRNIKPVFRTKNYLRLASYFPSINLRTREKQSIDLDSTACLAMFGILKLKPEIHEVADQMVERLKTLSRKNGQFVAVDLRVDVLEQTNCYENRGDRRKSCYASWEIADFLLKIGFDRDTTIYVTQTWWHESLNPLKDYFPNTYTKDDIIAADKKDEFLRLGGAELERALDFHVCSKSDVFVPAISGLFYGNVAGKRIASGRTKILVPKPELSSPAPAADFISTYVSKKNHMAYSCYC